MNSPMMRRMGHLGMPSFLPESSTLMSIWVGTLENPLTGLLVGRLEGLLEGRLGLPGFSPDLGRWLLDGRGLMLGETSSPIKETAVYYIRVVVRKILCLTLEFWIIKFKYSATWSWVTIHIFKWLKIMPQQGSLSQTQIHIGCLETDHISAQKGTQKAYNML